LGRFDDPVARARALAISAEIWSDFQQGDLDLSLNRYRPLVDGKDLDLLDGLRELMDKTKQARVIHAYRTILRFGSPLKSTQDVQTFVAWMNQRGLAPSTQSTILSTIRSVQPQSKALQQIQIKVPRRSVQQEVLSRDEIQQILYDMRINESWFYPCFFLWISTGLRNSELIGVASPSEV
jgi:hypothetical protein